MKRKHFQRILMLLSVLFILFFMNGCDNNKQELKNPDKEVAKEVTQKPLENSQVFANGIKDALADSSSQVDSLNSLQLDTLFQPMTKIHQNRSSSTIVTLKLQNPKASGEVFNVKTKSIHDANTGEASFVVSAGQGQEQGREGGVYFIGKDMLLKRGDTSKKMVKVELTPEQIASYGTVSPIERMTRTLEKDVFGDKDSKQWQTAVDDYVNIVTQSTEESNYAVNTIKLPLLSKEETYDAITLTLKENKAYTIMTELIKLFQYNDSMKVIYEGIGLEDYSSNEPTGLGWVQKTLESLSTDEIAALKLDFTFLKLNDKPLSILMEAATGEKTFVFKQIFYTKEYERHHEIYLKCFDDSGVLFKDTNTSTEGDNYLGDTIFKTLKAGGIEGDSFESHCTSFQNENSYKGDVQYTSISYGKDNGKKSSQRMSGKLSWSQEKNSTNGISATGSGELEISINGEMNKLLMDIVLDQSYENVSVSAPTFIENAGITATQGDDLYTVLDIEKDEYKNLSYMNKVFGSIAFLLN